MDPAEPPGSLVSPRGDNDDRGGQTESVIHVTEAIAKEGLSKGGPSKGSSWAEKAKDEREKASDEQKKNEVNGNVVELNEIEEGQIVEGWSDVSPGKVSRNQSPLKFGQVKILTPSRFLVLNEINDNGELVTKDGIEEDTEANKMENEGSVVVESSEVVEKMDDEIGNSRGKTEALVIKRNVEWNVNNTDVLLEKQEHSAEVREVDAEKDDMVIAREEKEIRKPSYSDIVGSEEFFCSFVDDRGGQTESVIHVTEAIAKEGLSKGGPSKGSSWAEKAKDEREKASEEQKKNEVNGNAVELNEIEEGQIVEGWSDVSPGKVSRNQSPLKFGKVKILTPSRFLVLNEINDNGELVTKDGIEEATEANKMENEGSVVVESSEVVEKMDDEIGNSGGKTEALVIKRNVEWNVNNTDVLLEKQEHSAEVREADAEKDDMVIAREEKEIRKPSYSDIVGVRPSIPRASKTHHKIIPEPMRLHGVAPVRSLPCTAHPMITFITSFELQMHPNVSKNFMWEDVEKTKDEIEKASDEIEKAMDELLVHKKNEVNGNEVELNEIEKGQIVEGWSDVLPGKVNRNQSPLKFGQVKIMTPLRFSALNEINDSGELVNKDEIKEDTEANKVEKGGSEAEQFVAAESQEVAAESQEVVERKDDEIGNSGGKNEVLVMERKVEGNVNNEDVSQEEHNAEVREVDVVKDNMSHENTP
ncbi:hypothetical protein DY000_02000135 [Brassica cretica]|uniref:Uncharacterized protein n=1 Tax=Brassica cretica TaxID=69181 RepID=A0ABQ7CJF5_BRACR|nr:hypothetical protein DY000_02000135 [Brassica cretica]